MTLRWKMNEKPRGLASIGAGPPGFKLCLDGKEIAHCYALRERYTVVGWYWVTPSTDWLPYTNTCGNPVSTAKEAKMECVVYVKTHLKQREVTHS